MPVRLPTLVHSNFSHLRVHRSSQLDVAKREAILAVQRAKELAASLAAVSGKAKAWASLSYELICTDPQISKHVHTLTGFHSVKALQLFMGLLNADGLFAGINPCTVPQESDVHHVEYVQNDRTPFQSGETPAAATASFRIVSKSTESGLQKLVVIATIIILRFQCGAKFLNCCSTFLTAQSLRFQFTRQRLTVQYKKRDSAVV